MDLGMSVYSQFNSTPTNPLAVQHLTSSQVYTAKTSGWVNFVVIGAGGGGKGGGAAGGYQNDYPYNSYVSSTSHGGGAGGIAIKSVYVQAGASYTITIGAGGSGSNNYAQGGASGNAATNTPGSSGTVTSVVGPGISLVVTAGQGGQAATGGIGGTVANLTNCTYDYYVQGGGSQGNVIGGGAVSIYGTPRQATASNGAGTGGVGSTNEPANGFSNAIGPNFTRTLAGGIATTSNYCETTSLTAIRSGVLSNCGGGGVYIGPGNVTVAGSGGTFAGGGACYASTGYWYSGYAEINGTGGPGGYGGGGGAGYGVLTYSIGSGATCVGRGTGGAGGQGFVIVEYL